MLHAIYSHGPRKKSVHVFLIEEDLGASRPQAAGTGPYLAACGRSPEPRTAGLGPFGLRSAGRGPGRRDATMRNNPCR